MASRASEPVRETATVPRFRIDVPLHEILTEPASRPSSPVGEGEGLPEPVYPQHPERAAAEADYSEYYKLNAARAWKTWGLPFFKSRFLHPRELRPIIAYLFSEWKCNLDCHYCWAFDNRVKGMSEAVARRSIDWLYDLDCRVLALMGGEPLLRPHFIHKITYYAAKKDFFVYLPTNGRLMRPDIIDRLGDAGLATVNLAVDSVKERPELPKALEPIRPYFDYLVKRQRNYGYTVVFNINITRVNLDDVKELTEIARANNVATDYHINEAPLIEQSHFQRLDGNNTYIMPEDYERVDGVLDWLIDKHQQGYRMVNPLQHLKDMKDLMRGQVRPWTCRAGQNTLIIRVDGTLAPCFPMYSATYDWGTVGEPRFDKAQLDEMKTSCNTRCLSTCNYILSYCYDTARVLRWMVRQGVHFVQGKGISGSF